MKSKLGILFAMLFILLQCKPTGSVSSSPEQEELVSFILLIQENVSPADLNVIKSMKVESMKRVSRTENRWMVKMIREEKSTKELMKILSEDDQVIEISAENEKNQPIQTTNTKSGKSGPIKN